MLQNRSLRFSVVGLFALILLISACDGNLVFEDNRSLPATGWNADSALKFSVDIKDPATPVNFYINVRNADGYPYSNLFLFIKTQFPDGKVSNDTLECLLADENGKWTGKGLGDIYDNRILFKRNVRFPLAGVYNFEIRQGMRLENVPLIMDAGLRIEKAE